MVGMSRCIEHAPALSLLLALGVTLCIVVCSSRTGEVSQWHANLTLPS
jgi:hypothetical protein